MDKTKIIENKNLTYNVEDKYQHMSDIDHVLERGGQYMGSMFFEMREFQLFKPSSNSVEMFNVGYNEGLLKLFDEILTNSIDEIVSETRLFDITKIDVHISKTGKISVRDNGGIPVVYHKGMKMMLPRMIFGTLKTSANYNGIGDRKGAGLNGLGAKLTNIYSKRFHVTTCDGVNKMDIQWSNNMKTIDFENVTPVANKSEHYTNVEFEIELFRFDINELDMNTVRILQKRCIDACATRLGLQLSFTTDVGEGKLDSVWQFNSFAEFVKIHTTTPTEKMVVSNKPTEQVIILPNVGYNYAFVNGAVCNYGTHINKFMSQIVKKVLAILKTKDIDLITDKDIQKRISIFASIEMLNPNYDSQAKTKLAVKENKTSFILSDALLDTIDVTGVVTELVDYYNIKYLAEKRKEITALNVALKKTKTDKLIPCSSRSTSKMERELWLFEGTSASEGFDSARSPEYQAGYLLRGKVKNTYTLTRSEIIKNRELREIIAELGIVFGDPKGNIARCKYKKIIFATDADTDGSHICGLLITFFAKNFPELFVAGYIYRSLSPIIVASKGTTEKLYYTKAEYEAEQESLKGYQIDYKKGLGSLEDHHYEDMVLNQRLEQFVLESDYLKQIEVWFSKSTEQRKAILSVETNMSEYDGVDEVMDDVNA